MYTGGNTLSGEEPGKVLKSGVCVAFVALDGELQFLV